MRDRVAHDQAPPGKRWCPKCKEFKFITQFAGAYCLACNREYTRKYRKENRGDEYTRLKTEALEHYGASCQRCGEADPSVLTFWPHGSKGIVAFLREMRKAEWPEGTSVLCLNCRHKAEMELVHGVQDSPSDETPED